MSIRTGQDVRARVSGRELNVVRFAKKTFAADTTNRFPFQAEAAEKLLCIISVTTIHRNSWIH